MASNPTVAEADKEQTLVSQAIDGDADAFGVLYTRHLDAIYRYVYFRVADEALAEELTGEVFVRAWTGLPNYQSRGHRFSSWLYRIAQNLLVDHYRRESSRAEIDEMGLDAIQSEETLPENQVIDRQELFSLAEAIRNLSQDEQQVIVLRFIEGLSHREVAEAIGKSEGASRVIQHRALENLVGVLKSDD